MLRIATASVTWILCLKYLHVTDLKAQVCSELRHLNPLFLFQENEGSY